MSPVKFLLAALVAFLLGAALAVAAGSDPTATVPQFIHALGGFR